MSSPYGDLTLLEALIRPLLLDTSLVERFDQSFGAADPVTTIRAFASRFIFLDWACRRSIKSSDDRMSANLTIVFDKLAKHVSASIRELEIHEFFIEPTEQQHALKMYMLHNVMPHSLSFSTLVMYAGIMRRSAYFYFDTSTNDLTLTLQAIAGMIEMQILGPTALGDEREIERCSFLRDELGAVEALHLDAM